MHKKILLMLSALSIAAALTSCGSTDSSDDVSLPQQDTQTTTVTEPANVTTATSKTDLLTAAVTTTPDTADLPEEMTTIESEEEGSEPVIEELRAEVTATVTKNGSGVKKATTTAKTTTTTVVLTTKTGAQTAYRDYEEPATSLGTENKAFTAADSIIAKAATLLGTPYGWGAKGYTGIYSMLLPNKALSVADIHKTGIDCSGLVFYTLTSLGYKASGFMYNNPMPVDTTHWLSVNDGSTISFGGVSSKVDAEKKGLSTAKYEYWERADGSTITPGSVVVGENLYDDNHAWIYMGEFETRNDVIAYLRLIGVPESLINSRTVWDGSGSGGTHWRIESCGNGGVVINNNTERENGITNRLYNIYSFRVTPKNTQFKIALYGSDGKAAGKSPIDGTAAVYGLYRDKNCKSKIKQFTVNSSGTYSIDLPPDTYYIKQLSCPAGYAADSSVYEIQAGTNKLTIPYLTACVNISMRSEDGDLAGGEFVVSWNEGGKDHSQTVTADSKGTVKLCGLAIYDMTSGKEIAYTVAMAASDTEHYIYPDAQTVKLSNGDVSISFERKCVPAAPPEDEGNGDTDTGDTDEPNNNDPDVPDAPATQPSTAE